ncbi:hypothetical protein HDK90DRAFT_318632 [Phyllosticta capitalensis]|uniref:Uncharacterized protein n=1 Tax=Phyllosticta capitalensis TaxID=121624 RepID=A0ABR1YHI2_9PEZI
MTGQVAKFHRRLYRCFRLSILSCISPLTQGYTLLCRPRFFNGVATEGKLKYFARLLESARQMRLLTADGTPAMAE